MSTTGRVFFRPWKNVVRKISDIFILENINIKLHLRNNIIKLQSLVHNQFSSPRFKNLIKQAWYQSGYLPNNPDDFLTPTEFCFVNINKCCSLCNTSSSIKCAWCTKCFCIHHFFIEYHYCKLYVE